MIRVTEIQEHWQNLPVRDPLTACVVRINNEGGTHGRQ